MAVRKLLQKIAKAVKWEHIDDNAVRENNIQDASVTGPKVATSAIVERTIASAAVTEPKYATGSVSNRALANGSVNIDKLDPAARTKASVGLGNVDNTSDANKPVSSATQAALNGKEATVAAGTVSDYWRGDKTMRPLTAHAVLANNVAVTGALTSQTTPGIYSYSAASGLPANATATGTLHVYSTGGSNRAQILVDSVGYAWSRAYNGSTWYAWNSITPGGTPRFFGQRELQVHAANAEERVDYYTLSTKHIVNNAGQLVISTPGNYRVFATASGPWKDNVSGTGRTLKIQKSGSTVSSAPFDVPVVWSGVGAFSLSVQAFVSCVAGDTIEGRFFNGTNNATIQASHRIEVVWVD